MSHRFRLLGAALLVVALCLVVSTGRAAEAASDSALGWVEDTVWRGHQGGINAVAVSADGSLIITGDSEGVVRVWDTADGKPHLYRGHSDSVLDVAFDPKGRFAVSAGADKTIRVLSLERSEATAVIEGSRGAVACVGVLTDPDLIVSGGADSVLRVWDTHTGNRVRSLSIRPGRPSTIHDILPSADGQQVFLVGGPFVSVDMHINAVHLETMQHMGWPYVTAPSEAVGASLAASADGKTVVAGGMAGVVTVWSPDGARARLTGHAGAVLGLAVSDDGSLVASGGQDGTVRVWDTRSTANRQVLEGHRGPVSDVAFGPEGEWLVSVGDDKTVRVWRRPPLQGENPLPVASIAPPDLGSTERGSEADMTAALERAREILALIAPQGEFETVAERAARIDSHNGLLPELRAIAAQEFDIPLDVDAVGRYDADAEAYAVTISKAGLLAPAVGSVQVSRSKARQAKGRIRRAWGVARLRISQDMLEAIPHLTEVAVWLDEKAWPVTFPSAWTQGFTLLKEPGHVSHWVFDVAFTPDEGLVATAGRGGSVRVWEAGSSRPVHVLEHGSVVTDVDFTSDGRELVSTGMFSNIRVWNVDTGENVRTFRHEGHMGRVAVSPTRMYIASGDDEGGVQVQDFATGDLAHAFEVGSAVRNLVFSADGAMLAVAASDGRIHVRATATGSVVADAATHSAPVMDMLLNSDGRMMSVAPNDGIRLWNMATLTSSLIPLADPWSGDIRVSHDPDRGVVIGVFGLSVAAWHLASGKRVQTIDMRPTGVGETVAMPRTLLHSIGYSPRYETLIVGENPGRVYSFWRVGADLAAIPLRTIQAPDADGPTAVVATEPTHDAPVVATPVHPVPVPAQVEPAQPEQVVEPGPETQPLDSTMSVPATALVVGINAYDHHANLVNPTVDAQAVGRELREVFGVETTTLLDPTKLEFLAGLHALADREFSEDEQLLVFFSGHGYFDERIRRGYLAFRDSLPLEDDPYLQSFVSHEDVRVLLERLDCNHVLLVVDSCYSGTLDPLVAMASGARPIAETYGLIPKAEYIRRKLQYRTRRYITAGGKEYVPDGRPGQHSPFARQFLAALRTFGGSDGVLTLEEIVLHLERVDPQPRTGELYGNEPGSSFVLVAGDVTEDAAPKFSSLVVTVSPPDADVRIVGGPPAAESLLKTLRVEPTGTAERRYHLPPGDYRVRVTRDGYAPADREVALSATHTEVKVTLRRP